MNEIESFLARIGGSPSNVGFHRMVAVIVGMDGKWADKRAYSATIDAMAGKYGVTPTTLDRSMRAEIERIYAADTEKPSGLSLGAFAGRVTPKRFCATVSMMLGGSENDKN